MINIDDFISSICRFGEVDGQVQSALSCRASMSTFVHMLYYTYMHILCIYIYLQIIALLAFLSPALPTKICAIPLTRIRMTAMETLQVRSCTEL